MSTACAMTAEILHIVSTQTLFSRLGIFSQCFKCPYLHNLLSYSSVIGSFSVFFSRSKVWHFFQAIEMVIDLILKNWLICTGYSQLQLLFKLFADNFYLASRQIVKYGVVWRSGHFFCPPLISYINVSSVVARVYFVLGRVRDNIENDQSESSTLRCTIFYSIVMLFTFGK